MPDSLALAIGDSAALTAIITDSAGAPLDSVPVIWSSDDPTVATVTDSGLVVAVGLGVATITAESEGFAGTAAVRTGLAFSMLSAGGGHTCGLVRNGAVWCWGDGRRGQLGNGLQQSNSVPVRVGGGLSFTTLSAGGAHTCALTDDGTAWCWGDGARGQRGDGTTGVAGIPSAVGGRSFLTLSAGTDHTCAIAADGSLWCWGANGRGQLGNATFGNRLIPDSVVSPERFSQVGAGREHTCAVSQSGSLSCWGRNDEGQLGAGFQSSSEPAPAAAATSLQFRTARAGWREYACGISMDRAPLCWGRGDDGELGLGAVLLAPNGPMAIGTAVGYTSLDPGQFHTCGTTTDLRTFCWGTSRLGLPGVSTSNVPLEIPILLAAIVTGPLHTCGVTPAGRAFCWGANDHGQLGTGTTTPSDVPVAVALQLQ